MTRTTADARQADVIVVGAGPAGSTPAYPLAQGGAAVVLGEKAGLPRGKSGWACITRRTFCACARLTAPMNGHKRWRASSTAVTLHTRQRRYGFQLPLRARTPEIAPRSASADLSRLSSTAMPTSDD